MATELGKAYVQVVPSAQGIKGALSKTLGGEGAAAGKSVGSSLAGKIKGAIAAAGIGATVVAGLKKSISEGAKLEQSIGGIETLFKSSSKQMIKYADNAYKTAGISANTYMEQATSFSASLLQSTGGDTKKAAKAANQAIIDMSDNSNKMGSNIEDIQRAYQGFARGQYGMLDNLKLGYGGTKKEMARLLEDAGKISGQKYDMSNLSDVYEAIHVVQGELGITGTSAKEAATTLSGSAASMSAAWDNFLGNLALGRNVGESMGALAETAANFLFNNLIPAIGRIISGLPVAIMAFIQTGVPAFMNAGKSLVDSLITGVTTTIPSLLDKISTFFVTSMPGMLETIVNRLLGFILKIGDFITAALPTFLKVGSNLIISLATGIWNSIPRVVSAVTSFVPKVFQFIKTNLPVIASYGGRMLERLAYGFVTNLPKIVGALAKLGVTILKNIIKLIPTVLSAGMRLIGGLGNGILRGASTVIKPAIKSVVNFITSPVRNAISTIKGIATRIAQALNFGKIATTVKNTFSKVYDAITSPIRKAKSIVGDAIDKIKSLFPLNLGKIFSGVKLPHFKISGGKIPWGIGGMGKKPSVDIEWYKKAEDQPYMFDNATLFGAGERNDEMLYGRKALMNDISQAVRGNGNKSVVINLYTTVNGADNAEEWATDAVASLQRKMRVING